MSTAPKAAAFALLIRLLYTSFPMLEPLWHPLMWAVAVLSMTVGNLAALRQENVKRMLAYSSIAHAGYLLAAFAGLGLSGIAAASFYTAAYAAMTWHLRRRHCGQRLRRAASAHRRFPRVDLSRSRCRRTVAVFPHFADRYPVYGRVFREVLLVFERTARRSGLARPDRPAELGIGCGLLPQLAVSVAQPPLAADAKLATPRAPIQVGVAVGAALAFSAAATLILGIAPSRVLRSAQAGAATFHRAESTPPGVAAQASSPASKQSPRLCA